MNQGYCIKCEYKNTDQLIDEYAAVLGYDDWKILHRDGTELIIKLVKDPTQQYDEMSQSDYDKFE